MRQIAMGMMQTRYVYDSTVYYRARYYDPSIGRFLSEDPIRFKAGVNFYDYVDNRPTKFKDPTGLLRDCDSEQVECFRKCWNSPVGCLPWPVGRGGSNAANRWSRYTYCQGKCLAAYLECEAENAGEGITQFCSKNPGTCMAAGAVMIIVMTPIGPVWVLAAL